MADRQTRDRVALLLRRAGFGANPQELERYVGLGFAGAVEELLHPERVPEDFDGLLADLGHILAASAGTAQLQIPHLPPEGLARDSYLAGGDDYELVFTAPAKHSETIAALATTLDLPLTCIGKITGQSMANGNTKNGSLGTLPENALVILDASGQIITPTRRGFDHFK